MSERTRYLLRFGTVMLIVASVGIARWVAVSSMQERVNDTVRQVFAREVASRLAAQEPGAPRGADRLMQDSAEVVGGKVAASLVARTWTVVAMLSLFAACLWVAHSSGHFVLTLLMGLWGWGVAAAVRAGEVALNIALYLDLRESVASHLLTYRASSVPFGLLFVTALLTTLPLEALLPWVAGWGVGWGIRAWRTARPPFGASGLQAAVATPAQSTVRCGCGMLNVGNATACYACGAALEPVAVED